MKKLRANKRGFTLIELVLVFVVAAILSSIAISKIHTNSLLNAARSVLNDVVYLKYLALNVDVYDDTANYTNSYYQLYFHCVANTKATYGKYKCNHEEIGYSIFSDKLGFNTSNPDSNELAKDYLNSDKLLGARFAGINIDDKLLSKRTNLSKSFNIKKVDIFYKAKNKIRKANRLMANELGEFFVSSYHTKSKTYNMIKSSDYVIRLMLADSANKDNSICIHINNTGFANIPKITQDGQIIWYSGVRNIPKYCHDLANH